MDGAGRESSSLEREKERVCVGGYDGVQEQEHMRERPREREREKV